MLRLVGGAVVAAVAVSAEQGRAVDALAPAPAPKAAAAAGAAAVFLEDFTPAEVGKWLEAHHLDAQFGAQFSALGYDGDVLVNYLREADVTGDLYSTATRPHVAKLFDKIKESSRKQHGKSVDDEGVAPTSPSSSGLQQQRRRLADSGGGSSFSGIEIRRDNGAIFFGKDADVGVTRAGADVLATPNQFQVQGVDVARASTGLATSSAAWAFLDPGVKNYFMTAVDFTLPKHFTIETWIKPIDTSGYALSFASEDSADCLRLKVPSTTVWHHLVVSYDRHMLTVHDNGKVAMNLVVSDFCGDYTGALVIGHDQDTLGGWFSPEESARMHVDTVAVYARAFDETERFNPDKTCVDMSDPSLVSVWSGNTRGKDLLGQNVASVAFEEFSEGVNGNASCSVRGFGAGNPASEYANYNVSHVTAAVGGVGWVFPGSDTAYHLHVEPLTLPLDWTISMWIYPLDAGDGTMFLSFATTTNSNCMFLVGTADWDLRTWHHIVVTWDGDAQTVYLDGAETSMFTDRTYSFCGTYTGSLSIGQEQDAYGGSYSASQAPAMILDTVAIYSRAWTYKDVATSSSPCINLNDGSLYALYSGYSRGRDLVGSQDGDVTPIEIVTPGQSTTSGATYGWDDGDVVFDVETCAAAQQAVGAVPPSFTDSLVGGVAWDFLGDSEGYYFATQAEFTFPSPAFTIEFWAFPRSKRGHLLSFASKSNSNCLLLVNNRFDEYNVWYHMVVTVDSDGATTTYANGEVIPTTWSDYNVDFCGDYSGHLVFGQEQDAFLGGFDANQAFDGLIDTVAVYSGAWTQGDIPANKPVGVNLTNVDLYALYSGYTKGRDLVGSNDAMLWLYKFADGMPDNEANPHTLDMVSPSSVGGVAWDFPANQIVNYLQSNFTLPSGSFTFEFWVNAHSVASSKYFLSFAAPTYDNCLIAQMTGFTSSDVGQWRHFVYTYDNDNSQAYTYLDGTVNSNLLWTTTAYPGGFCGQREGSLVLGQEQDSFAGGFQASQAADMAIDTVAVYSAYWDSDKVNDKLGQCVSLQDPTLFTVWSGFSKGKDLVGENVATVIPAKFVSGASLDCTE